MLFRSKDVPGQYAYQSVWLKTKSNPDCPTCGTNPVEDNFATPVDLAALAPVDDAQPEQFGPPDQHEVISPADNAVGESAALEASNEVFRVVER